MITEGQINLFWVQKHRPELRGEAVTIAKAVQIHSRKIVPDELLNVFRPNETEQAKAYRKSVYKPKTFGWFNKVVQQYAKIRRAEDWRVEWPSNLGKNPLQEYTQGNFGEYNTVENWVFNFYLRSIIDDPNGVWLVLPENIERLLTGEDRLNPLVAFKPKVFYFPSSAVREYTEDLIVIDAVEHARDAEGRVLSKVTRPVMYFFDKDQVVKIVQTQAGNNPLQSVYSYTHGLGLTGNINGGLVAADNQQEKRKLFWSFIEPALPFWAEAIEIESDHRVNLALHIHPDRWEITSETCTHQIAGNKCDGGKIKMRVGRGPVQEQACPNCQGTSKVSVKTPFGVTKIRPIKTGMSSGDQVFGPTPPMGYAERPVETIKIVKELADNNIFDGLAALNLEVLAQGTKLAQSGTAKAMDNQEAETFVAQFAQHIVESVLVNIYYFCARWMMPAQSEEMRKRLLPSINTPRKFDLVTTEVWIQRVAAYKKDGAAPTAQAEAEKKLAERQYGADSIAFKRIRDSIDFDPLYGVPADLKLTATREDLVLSSKIGYFLTRAGAETKNAFFDLPFDAKVKTLAKYVQETIAPAGAVAGAIGGQTADPSTDPAADDPRASLRNSVGASAIIGALRLQVAKGLSTVDAAVAQLVIQLGYTREQALEMIGTPVDIEAQVKDGTVPAAAGGAAA